MSGTTVNAKNLSNNVKKQENYLRLGTDESKRIFITERKACKKILQQEKKEIL